MNEYPKIETLYERDERFSVTDVLKRPVLASINPWIVTEKVDGTNIRVHLDATNAVTFGGRTGAAQLNADLVTHLHRTFTPDKLAALRRDPDPVSITLFGEGYGAGIQKGGGAYRPDKGFILFDVQIGERWWLDDGAVTEIAEKLNIPRVPLMGPRSLTEIRELVKAGFPSIVAEGRCQAEGIVARTIEPLFDARGHRLIIKLKTKDLK